MIDQLIGLLLQVKVSSLNVVYKTAKDKSKCNHNHHNQKNKIRRLKFAALKSNCICYGLWDLPNDLFSCPELKYITSQKHSSVYYWLV